MKIFIFFIIFLIQFSICLSYEKTNESNCLNKIYHECSHESEFTEEEVENVRIYLQTRFAKSRPVGKPCARLHVRKDIKCMSKLEVSELIQAMKVLYVNGFMDRMARIHYENWPQVHKYGEGLPWHRWFINIFEQELQKVNPRVTLPYWEYFTDFAEPHRSIVWDYFGGAGNARYDFCVMDGPFANQTVKTPTPHCLRRQWNEDGTLDAWESPEWATAFLQRGLDLPLLFKELILLSNWTTADTLLRNVRESMYRLHNYNPTVKVWSQIAQDIAYSGHFKTHISIGGYRGDMSHPFAPNDPVFYIFHTMAADLIVLKWQLSDDKNLVPNDYGLGIKYDSQLGRTAVANIETDSLTFYTDVKVKETFQIGFGQLCYIHDQFVKPINQLMRSERQPLPEAVHRLQSTLPGSVFANYYPKFAYYPNRVAFFDFLLPDVGNCSTTCRTTPVAKRYSETAAGRRNWRLFQNALGFDLTLTLKKIEESFYRYMNFINAYNYCSPYVF